MKKKIFLILATLAPLIYWVSHIFWGDLGADPAKKLNHQMGEWGLYLLLLNSAIGWGLVIAKKTFIQFPVLRWIATQRREIGIVSFVYLIAHFVFYAAMESFEPQAWTQLYTKTYLILGLTAWIILLSLTMTSNDFSVKKLSMRIWKRWHRLVYVCYFLICAHVMLIEKTDLIKYGSIFLVFFALQGYRFVRNWKN